MRIRSLLVAAAVAAPAFAAGPGLPTVSVSGVTATSPVLRSTPGIAVSATVNATFDVNGGLEMP